MANASHPGGNVYSDLAAPLFWVSFRPDCAFFSAAQKRAASRMDSSTDDLMLVESFR